MQVGFLILAINLNKENTLEACSATFLAVTLLLSCSGYTLVSIYAPPLLQSQQQ